VATAGDAAPGELGELGGKGRLSMARRLEGAGDAPIARAMEGHAGLLALDHQARPHRLHTTSREPRTDLAPQNGRDLITEEPVEDPPRLLGRHQACVQIARFLQRGLDSPLRDLVKCQALDRHLGLEHLEQVPRDSLALAVFICREVEQRGLLEQRAQLLDLRLLLVGHHVDRLEVVVDVDTEPAPALLAVSRGDLVGLGGQIAHMPDR
jgi:hypothetical protein